MKAKKIVTAVLTLTMALSIMPNVGVTFFMGKVQASGVVITDDAIYYHGQSVTDAGTGRMYAMGYKDDRDDATVSFNRVRNPINPEYEQANNSMMLYFGFDGYGANSTNKFQYVILKRDGENWIEQDSGGKPQAINYIYRFTFVDKRWEHNLANQVPDSSVEHPDGEYILKFYEAPMGQNINTATTSPSFTQPFTINKITLYNVDRIKHIISDRGEDVYMDRTDIPHNAKPFTSFEYMMHGDHSDRNFSAHDLATLEYPATAYALNGEKAYHLPFAAPSGYEWADKNTGRVYTNTENIEITADREFELRVKRVTPSSNTNSGNTGGGGGGGSSSNTKTTTKRESDGSKVTTSVSKSPTGSTTTTTKIAKDGTKTVSKTVVNNKTGTKTETATVTGTDGGKLEKKTETLKDGSVTETTVATTSEGDQQTTIVGVDPEGEVGIIAATMDKEGNRTSLAVYEAEGKNLTISQAQTTKSTMVIPDTVKAGGKTFKVTEIADGAFRGNKKLTKIEIGKNIKTIGENAFRGNSKLKSITIKGKITDIESGAFKGINKNAVIKIKSSVKGVFKTIAAITKAGAPETVTYKKI